MFRLFLIALIVLCKVSLAVDNGLGHTPPMGWNSWNKFACNINETLIKNIADRIVQLGLDKKGYVYINLDDCWQMSRNQSTGEIIEDFATFPSGIHSLSQYVHSKGLKFGLYSDAGQKTCQGRPGGYGHEKIDAATYAKWEVDYLKYDNCYHPNVTAKLRYYAMYKALNDSGRPIFFSLCNWGQESVWQWAPQYGNSWRTTGDIEDKWVSFLNLLEAQVGLQKYSGPGGWNDPDMLEVGNGGMTHNEYYAHFAFWCALKSPLLIGCDLTTISQQTLQILGNEQLIAINQDPLGIQVRRIKQQVHANYKRQVWAGPLANNKYVIIFFNKGETNTTISISLKKQLHLDYSKYTQRDPIRHKDITTIFHRDELQEKVAPHSVQVRVLTLTKSNLVLQQ